MFLIPSNNTVCRSAPKSTRRINNVNRLSLYAHAHAHIQICISPTTSCAYLPLAVYVHAVMDARTGAWLTPPCNGPAAGTMPISVSLQGDLLIGLADSSFTPPTFAIAVSTREPDPAHGYVLSQTVSFHRLCSVFLDLLTFLNLEQRRTPPEAVLDAHTVFVVHPRHIILQSV